MLNLLSLALLAGLTPVSQGSKATDWWWIDTVGSPPSRVSAYLDRSSFEVEGEAVLAWSAFVREAPTETGEYSRRELMAFSCADETTRLVARVGVNRRNEVIEHLTFATGEQLAEPLVPDSLTESLWNFVCDYRSGAEKRVKDVPLDLVAAFTR